MSTQRGRDGRRRYQPDWRYTVRGRRRLSRTMLTLGALIAVAGVGGLLSRGGEESLALEGAAAEWRLDAANDQRVEVMVDRVIDGDTLDVLSAFTGIRVRLFGVDTPERGERCFEEATARLVALAGTTVTLLPDERLQDGNGRELRYVFAADGRSIDAALIAEGLAEAWRQDGAFRDQLVELEDEAREAGTGCLWSDA